MSNKKFPNSADRMMYGQAGEKFAAQQKRFDEEIAFHRKRYGLLFNWTWFLILLNACLVGAVVYLWLNK